MRLKLYIERDNQKYLFTKRITIINRIENYKKRLCRIEADKVGNTEDFTELDSTGNDLSFRLSWLYSDLDKTNKELVLTKENIKVLEDYEGIKNEHFTINEIRELLG